MSSLTDEQKRRIEENRASALAKLATKRSSANVARQENAGCSSKNHLDPSSASISKGKIHVPTKQNTLFYGNVHQDGKRKENGMNGQLLSRFQYINKGKTVSKVQTPANTFRTKNINDVLGKKSVIHGTCVLIDRTRFKVVVGFHSELIGVFKTLPSRCYDVETQTWNFLLQDYEKLMTLCRPLVKEVALSGVPNGVLNLFLTKKPNSEHDLVAKGEINWDIIEKKLFDSLMPFQKDGVIFSIKQNGRILLADDMGLGKTIQAIAVACYYRKRWPLLIVVPSSLRMTWKRAIVRWITSLDADLVNVVFTGKDEVNAGLVNIISYDLLVKKIKSVETMDYKVIIVDECHFIKNNKAERTKAILPLLKASSHVILLSGTPALSRPAELYTQISAVNPKLFPSFHKFGVRYCAGVKNKFGWDYCGSSNMEELQLILEDCIMIRRLKKVVLDQLPSKTREVVFLDPSLIKEKTLARAKKQLSNAKEKEKRSAVLGYFNDTCSVKAAAVREYIIDLVEGGHKMIVFAHHQEMLDVICQSLIKKKVEYIRIDGKTPSEKRQHLCDQFQRDLETRVAVLSITAANTGLTLTEATSVVFAELFWNPGALVQAEDRAYRIGQKNSVVIHYLIAKKTADDYLWPLIQMKLDVLSKAGLNKENFSDIDSKTFQDPKQRDLKVLFESLVDEYKGEKCLGMENKEISESENKKQKMESDNLEVGETSSKEENNDLEQVLNNSDCLEDEWFDDLNNDDWAIFSVDNFDTIKEPNAKRKRF